MTNTEVQEIKLRWRFQCGELKKFLGTNDTPMAEAVRGRLMSIATSAGNAGVALDVPGFVDQVFDTPNVARVFGGVVTGTGAVAPVAPVAAAGAKGKRRHEGVRVALAEEPGPVAPVVPAAPAPVAALVAANAPAAPLHECADGCGVMVKGRFSPGHETKYHSLIRKVETGVLTVSELPARMQADLVWDPETRLCVNPQTTMRRHKSAGTAAGANASGTATPAKATVFGSHPVAGYLAQVEADIAAHTAHLDGLKQVRDTFRNIIKDSKAYQ